MSDDAMTEVLREARAALACVERASAVVADANLPGLQRSLPTLARYIRDRLVAPAACYLEGRPEASEGVEEPGQRLVEARQAARRASRLFARQPGSRPRPANNPDGWTTETSTTTRNGKTWTDVWNKSTRTRTMTSPVGRVTTTLVDDRGRTLSSAVAGLEPMTMAYNAATGRMASTTWGARTQAMAYGSDGYLAVSPLRPTAWLS